MEDESSMLFPESRIEIESDFQSSIRQPMDEQKLAPQVKALNPHQYYKDYPPQLKMNFINSSFKKKYFAGIQTLFGITTEKDQSNMFLQKIDAQLFENSREEGLIHFNNIFKENQIHHSPQEHISYQLNELTQKFSQIQKKAFAGISINKTIGIAFMEHFENFLYLKEQANFISKFSESLKNFYEEAKRVKSPGISLIILTYEFWMRMFRDFVREIWKYSQKHTLTHLKKKEGAEKISNRNTFSTNSSQISTEKEKEKRKQWSHEEVELLQKNISYNPVFTQMRLNQISVELDRTPSSISSKIQKICKKRKNQEKGQFKFEDSSIQEKILFILKSNTQGLSKERIIEQMSGMYEMDEDESWKKSVGTLLSSSKSIERVKANFSLKNSQYFNNYLFTNTMKDKVVQCLLGLPNCCGDLKTIVKVYMENFLFIEQDHQEQNQKQIEKNISKVLARYDIFEKDKNKTTYRLNEMRRLGIQQVFNEWSE